MLTLQQERVDLGKIKLLQPKVFEVNIMNDGNEDILVTRIIPGCGSCTTASITNALVKANSTEQIKVVFTPKNLGVQEKRVTINGNLTLRFTSDVQL